MAKQGTKYEILTQSIYGVLLKNQYDDVKIEQDIKLKGQSSCDHQIDVFTSFSIKNTLQHILIECKDYEKHKIGLELVRNFHSVINDVKPNLQGECQAMMITKIGYTMPAKTYADYYNIDICILREFQEQDSKDRITNILTQIVIEGIKDIKVEILVDIEWIRQNFQEGKVPQINLTMQELDIYNSDGSIYTNARSLSQQINSTNTGQTLYKTFFFDNHYIEIPEGKIKVKGLRFEYMDAKSASISLKTENEQLGDFILKNILTEKTKFISKDGNILGD